MTASLAKISRPRLQEVHPRERLFSLLDQAVQRQVIWLSAPPGSGKTTLIGSWLDARSLPVLWYRLDAGDSDLATFFYYLGLAAKQATPRYRKPFPLFTPEYQSGLSVFSKRFFENLFCRFKPPAVIVFDDYHEIPPGAPFHSALREGLKTLPDGITVVLISREAPVAALASLKAGGRMATLGWADLRLTFDETRGLANLHGMKEQPLPLLRQLHDKARGWAAGLVLMMTAENAGAGQHPPQIEAPSQEIFDYFAGELFDKADAEKQKFLLTTAFLPSITAIMGKRLSGVAASGKILSYLCHNHYFTEMHSKDTPVYHYHPLFREFLLSRAMEWFQPKELNRVRRAAATLLAEDGQAENAAALLREAGDWEGLAKLALNQAQPLMEQGRHLTLQEWIEAVPQEVKEQNAWLLYWMGVCRLPVDPNDARNRLEKALAEFDADANSAGVFTAWACAVDSFMLDPSGATQLDHWITLIDKLMEKYPLFPSPAIEAHVATGILFALAIRQPQRPETEEWAKRALALAIKMPEPQLYIKTALCLILHHTWRGDLVAAKLVIDSLRESVVYQKASPPVTSIHLRFLEALYCWTSSQPEACLIHVSEALAISQTTGVHLLDYMLLGQGTSAALSQGALETATKFLGEMAPVLGSGRRNDISYYYHLSSWHSLLRGDLVRARVEAEEALNLAVDCGSPFAEGVCCLMLAHVLHRCGELRRATAYLAQALRIGNSMKSAFILFPAHLLDALFSFDRGDEPGGLACLRSGLNIGRNKGLMNYDGWNPAVMARLCALALDSEIEPEYVRDMIRKQKLVPANRTIVPASWPWPLQISTLGRFEIVKEGKPVIFSGKVQKKPLELLKALVALGGKDVREEHISDILWPDVEGDQAHKSFETNLLRLRRLLGHDSFVQLREGRLTLAKQYCLVDVWALEEVMAQIHVLWREDANAVKETERLMQKVFALYEGDFLAGIEYPWALPTRMKLRSKFLHCVEEMGRLLTENGQHAQAVACYIKGLDADDLAEELYQGLMTCYGKLGHITSASDAYNRCRTVLATKLGIIPSPKTKAIYHALQKGI